MVYLVLRLGCLVLRHLYSIIVLSRGEGGYTKKSPHRMALQKRSFVLILVLNRFSEISWWLRGSLWWETCWMLSAQ